MSSYRIGKRFTFDAAHQLPDLPEGHKCGRVHGHTYTVEVTLAADELTPPGFVADFADLAPLGAYVNGVMDHYCLNDTVPVTPTSELLAHHVHDWCVANLATRDGVVLEAVRVSETTSTWAEYRP